MEECVNVGDWLHWAAKSLVGSGYPEIQYEALPEHILKHPLDAARMADRVKLFAASVALHQAFVDLKPFAPEKDNFRSMLDEVRDIIDDTGLWVSLLRLKKLADEARHQFEVQPKGDYFTVLADWPLKDDLNVAHYGFPLLTVKCGEVVENVHDMEEDDNWANVKIFETPGYFKGFRAPGWVPKSWLSPVPCGINK